MDEKRKAETGRRESKRSTEAEASTFARSIIEVTRPLVACYLKLPASVRDEPTAVAVDIPGLRLTVAELKEAVGLYEYASHAYKSTEEGEWVDTVVIKRRGGWNV